jgi:hypothetical protein
VVSFHTSFLLGRPPWTNFFLNFSNSVFHGGRGQSENFHIFQPGRKKHEALVSAQDGAGCLVLVWIPEQMGSVEELLFALDEGFAKACTGFYNWEDRIMFSRRPLQGSAAKRFAKLDRSGDGSVLYTKWSCTNQKDLISYFPKAFPKCNAACMSRKASDRGWISYTNGVLQLCRGTSETPKW